MVGCKPSSRIAAAAVVLGICLFLSPPPSEAAVGCTLTNPAQDLKYLFPEMTTYKEELRELNRLSDGKVLYAALQERLGSDLDPVYETYDTPYTVYTVFKGREVIGIVHGVNVPGEGGLIQVFLSADPKSGIIRRVFFQRLESVAARALRNKGFLDQFRNLSLADFYRHDYYRVAEPGNQKDPVARIQSPVAEGKGRRDYEASVRGVRKNLILLDIFIYERRFEPFYQRSVEALSKIKAVPR
ncbi:MAG: hypothetical protein FJW35_00770 [Acidobacteria bacterium]|nr:hypothetical protein [Acidobacteriota bacterium]